jgi:hypothetical protein
MTRYCNFSIKMTTYCMPVGCIISSTCQFIEYHTERKGIFCATDCIHWNLLVWLASCVPLLKLDTEICLLVYLEQSIHSF